MLEALTMSNDGIVYDVAYQIIQLPEKNLTDIYNVLWWISLWLFLSLLFNK